MAQITYTNICNIQNHLMQCILETIPQLMKENNDVEYDFTRNPGNFLVQEYILGVRLSDDKLLFRTPEEPENFRSKSNHYFAYDTLTLLLATVETCTFRKNRKLFKKIGVIKKE